MSSAYLFVSDGSLAAGGRPTATVSRIRSRSFPGHAKGGRDVTDR